MRTMTSPWFLRATSGGVARAGGHSARGESSDGDGRVTQQRVAIARAFAPRPTLVLADEPTGNLVAESGRHVADLLFTLVRDANTTLMLVTHDAELANRCDRVVHMVDGQIAETR